MDRIRKKRRIVTIRTLIISFVVAALLCSLFAFCFWKYMVSVAKERCLEMLDSRETSIRSTLDPDRVQGQAFTMTDFRCTLAGYAYYRIPIPLSNDASSPELISGYSEGCHAYAFAWDEEGNRVASSSCSLYAYLKFGEDSPYNGYYVCDRQDSIPGIRQLYDDHKELIAQRKDLLDGTTLEMESAYVNREKRTFIPAKGRIVLEKAPSAEEFSLSDIVEVESREINITVDDETYEFVEFAKQWDEYPRVYVQSNFFGEDPELVEKAYRDDVPENGMRPIFVKEDARMIADGIIRARRTFRMYVNHVPYDVCLLNVVDCNSGEFVKYYRKYAIPFCLVVLVLTALVCRRKLAGNKTRWAMEDYQRDLTNHLAHDIKTPLMAIGGYAENIKEVELTGEEKQHYLDAILENVAFTDSLINRTLYLNSMEDRSVVKPETIAVDTVVADSLKKYEALLEKNGIRCNVEGSATVNADRTLLATIVENLVSNAVKYTPDNGIISAKVDPAGLTIVNTVAKKIEVKNLTTPFVRGDRSRSNTGGTGLGLSLADRAAAMCGFSLKLLCTDDEFTAKLMLNK